MDREDGPFRGSGTNLDTYEKNRGIVGQPEGCSYCGSLPPDMFMEHIRDGTAALEATDKSYKLYLDIPNPNEGGIRVSSRSDSTSGGGKPWEELTDVEKKAVKSQWKKPRGGIFGKGEKRYYKDGRWDIGEWGATVHCKFYTAHLSEEQGREFEQLFKDNKIVWKYPLYRPLYIPGIAPRT